MRKIIALFTFFVFSVNLSAQINQENAQTNSTNPLKVIPNAQLPQEPHPNFWLLLQNEPDELTDDQKQEYLTLLWDFYRVSDALQQQLNQLGSPARTRLEAPPIRGINQIEDVDLDLVATLRTQIQQARNLIRQVENIDLPLSNRREEALRNQVVAISKQASNSNFELQKQIIELNEKLQQSKLEALQNQSYQELFLNSQETIRNIHGLKNRHTVPTLAVTVGAAANIFYDDKYSPLLAPSIGINFNPSAILGMIDIFDVWADYSNPNVKVENYHWNYGFGNYTVEHSLNNLSAGVNLRFKLSEYFNIKTVNWLLKGGVGCLWMFDKMPNTHFTSNTWQGYLFRVETEVLNFSSQLPIGIYASYSFNKTQSNLTSNNVNNWDFNRQKFGTLNLGLKFFILAHSPLNKKECK